MEWTLSPGSRGLRGLARLTTLPDFVIHRIRQAAPSGCDIIPGSTPVLSFGDPTAAWVATIGSNPGRSAFLEGDSLVSTFFETLGSLEVEDLSSAPMEIVERVYQRCVRYFEAPYHRRWFGGQKPIVEPWALHMRRAQHATSISCSGQPAEHGRACRERLVRLSFHPVPPSPRGNWSRVNPSRSSS